MTVDRRGFAKSLTGVLGAAATGSSNRAPSQAPTTAAQARHGAPAADEDHPDPGVLSAELRPQQRTGVPAEQHGRPRGYRGGDHRRRAGGIARHGPQRGPQRHRQERLRHRDDLAGGVHGRVLLARQGAAARHGRHRPGAVGHQGQGAQRAALSAVRRQGARAHRAVRDVGAAAGRRAAGRSGGDGAQGARGGDDGGRLSCVSRRRRHPPDARAARPAAPRLPSSRCAAASSIRERAFRRSSRRSSRFARASGRTATG